MHTFTRTICVGPIQKCFKQVSNIDLNGSIKEKKQFHRGTSFQFNRRTSFRWVNPLPDDKNYKLVQELYFKLRLNVILACINPISRINQIPKLQNTLYPSYKTLCPIIVFTVTLFTEFENILPSHARTSYDCASRPRPTGVYLLNSRKENRSHKVTTTLLLVQLEQQLEDQFLPDWTYNCYK